MSKRRTLSIGFLLSLLAAGSWWLQQNDEEQVQRRQRDAHTPDYWVEGLTVRSTDEQGRLQRILSAQTLTRYPDDGSTELTQPKLQLLEPGRPPWRIDSHSGWVSPDGKLVYLKGTVDISREASPGRLPVHLITRDLMVQPHDQYAETEHPVRIRSGEHWLKSVGLQAWLQTPVRIKLLADVRGHYEVNSQ